MLAQPKQNPWRGTEQGYFSESLLIILCEARVENRTPGSFPIFRLLCPPEASFPGLLPVLRALQTSMGTLAQQPFPEREGTEAGDSKPLTPGPLSGVGEGRPQTA
jgi:hypothetical protein